MPTPDHDAYVYDENTLLETFDNPGANCAALAYMLDQSQPYVEMTAVLKDDNGAWCKIVGPRPTLPPS